MHLEKMKDGGYTFHNFEKGDTIQRRDLIGDGWVARLTGLHPKYRYQRQFVVHPTPHLGTTRTFSCTTALSRNCRRSPGSNQGQSA
jgi:hypothetical protein